MSKPKSKAPAVKPPACRGARGAGKDALFDLIVSILEQARGNVVRAVNTNMVLAYWLIGREIIEEIQRGKERAKYGEKVIQDLSARLTGRYGKGFSKPALWNFRQFYLAYPDRAEILSPVGRELADVEKLSPAGRELTTIKIQYPTGAKSQAVPISSPAGGESSDMPNLHPLGGESQAAPIPSSVGGKFPEGGQS